MRLIRSKCGSFFILDFIFFFFIFITFRLFKLTSMQADLLLEYVSLNKLFERKTLVGLTPLITNDCSTYWTLDWSKSAWTQFTNFFFIPIFYHLIILQYNWTKYGIKPVQRDNDSSVHEEVIFSTFCLSFPYLTVYR